MDFHIEDEDESSLDEDDIYAEYPDDSDDEDDLDANEDEKKYDTLFAEPDEAEKEIDDDFSRLVGNIRETNDIGVAGELTKSWDIPIEESQDSSFHDDLRAASGVGRDKRKRRMHNQPVLSQQVKSLIGQGSQAYVDQQLDVAIRTMQEVIRIEPRASAAWSILIACHRDLGQSDKVLQLGIMSAHLDGDYEQWFKLADESKERGFINQAIYCYRKASLLNPTSVDADWERATLAKEIGDLRTVKFAYMSILRRFPHDITVLTELRPILIELAELAFCQKIYAAAFQHYLNLYPSGRVVGDDGKDIIGGGFNEFHIYVLADLHNMLGDYEKAIDTIKTGIRWLQGRADQKIWKTVADDREYDTESMTRVYDDEEDTSTQIRPGKFELDVNARHRLAIARLKLGEIEEGKLHCKVILSCDLREYAPLFQEIADVYFEKELYDLAVSLYEELASDEQTSSLHVLQQTALCRRHMNDLKGSAEVYEHVIANWPDNMDAKMKLAEVYEIMGDPRKALNLVYQVIDARKRRSIKAAPHGSTHSAGGDQGVPQASTSLFDEKSSKPSKPSKTGMPRLTPAQLKAFEKERQEMLDHSYKRCKELHDAMREGESEAEAEWLLEAEKLVEHFRETRQLFPTAKVSMFAGLRPSAKARYKSKEKKTQKEVEKEVDDVASRLQLEIEYESPRKDKLLISIDDGKLTVFRGITIEDWFALIIQYAFVLSKRNLYGIANEVLRHIRLSIVFQDISHQDSIRLSLIACAMQHHDYDTITEQCRIIINAHQFNNEPLRILAMALGSGLRAADAFINSKLQKHLLRELRTTDAIVNGRDVKWNAGVNRYVLRDDKDADDGIEEDPKVVKVREGKGKKRAPIVEQPLKPTKSNPVHLTMYGLLCGCAKSYQSALFYLLQSYDAHPDDPVTCLALGIASIGRAMQRQADNRHLMIIQGFAFFSRYRTIRGGDEGDIDEVDYNFGRAFQQLGLHAYAVKHYENVLKNAEARLQSQSQEIGLAREAAYNLSIIFVTTGATKLAEGLYRRWLSV